MQKLIITFITTTNNRRIKETRHRDTIFVHTVSVNNVYFYDYRAIIVSYMFFFMIQGL